MAGFIIFLMFLAIPLLLWNAISPVGAWETTASWRYKDPEANRPSDAQFTITRVVSIVMIPVVIGLMFAVNSAFESNAEQQEKDNYQSCLVEHQGDESLLSPEEWCENLSPGARED